MATGGAGLNEAHARHQLAWSGAGLATDEAPSNAAAATQVSGKESLWFELVTAALYHRDRLTWFIALHRGSMFANAFLGTAAVATLLQQQRWLIVAASLLLAFVSAASLAFDFAGSARKHEDRRRTYHDLAAQLEESADDEGAVRLLRAKMIRTAGDDPVVYKAAESVAYNVAIKSLGRDLDDEFILTPRQRFFRDLLTYSGAKFPQRRDLNVSR